MLLALGLHVVGFALVTDAAQEELINPPAPIQVAWIDAPQSKAETTPAVLAYNACARSTACCWQNLVRSRMLL